MKDQMMKDRTMKDQIHEIEDVQVEAALRHFRESVHGWSEQEFSKARTIRRSRWDRVMRMVANPVLGSALAGVLVIASAGVPAALYHERQVAADHAAKLKLQQELDAKKAEQLQAAVKIDDDELLRHVDSDIAQAAPDAMEPLASLMSDSATK